MTPKTLHPKTKQGSLTPWKVLQIPGHNKGVHNGVGLCSLKISQLWNSVFLSQQISISNIICQKYSQPNTTQIASDMHKNRIKKEKQREANHAKEGERDRHGFY
jgi:hypothetical protein